MNTRSRSSGRKKQAKFSGIPPSFSYGSSKPKRLKDFSCRSPDGHELKVYIGHGCVPSNYGINDLMMKYPQFTVYDKTSLGSAFNRLKKHANSLNFERKNNKNSKFFFYLKCFDLMHVYIYIYI